MRTLVFAVLAVALFAAPAFADGPAQETPDVAAAPIQAPARAAPTPAPTAEPAATPAIGQTGAISLPQDTGLALNVPAGYRFYSADEARAFLQRSAAAEPPGTILGLLAPAGSRIDRPDAWATVLTFQPIGYVPSENAGRLTDPAFEAEVRTARQNARRPFEGFALAPAFAAAGPSVTWAERAAPPGAGGRDLRHEQRLLGRNGIAVLTSIGSADQLGAVTAAAPDLTTMVSFGAGQRYADFNTATDRRSDFDVPGLVTGVSAQGLVGEAASADEPPPADAAPGGLMGLFPWIALGVAVLAGAGFLLMRRRGRRDPDDNADDNITPRA